MDNRHAADAWFEQASSDLRAAEFLASEMQPTPVEIVCYHCEQAAEKYLKGYLVLNGVTPQRTHDLSVLGAACSEFSKSFDDAADKFAALSEYAVHIRYPSQIDISEGDMKQALANARDIEDITISLVDVENTGI
jgi:HEPN domain-containing protein